jgi:hypothetical protein
VAFLILAGVGYLAGIVPYQKAKQHFFPASVEAEGLTEEVALLTQSATPSSPATAHPVRPSQPAP